MTFSRLILRNLLFHWRGNCAVFLGVVVGTAVLTGALFVGDSLRGSLRDLTLQQLEWVDHALLAGRFFREELAGRLAAERIAPAILLQGSASTAPGTTGEAAAEASVRRVGRVTILGVDDRFWPAGEAPVSNAFWRPADPDDPDKADVVVNAALAQDLGVQAGDRIYLRFQKSSSVPRESVLGRRDAEEVVARLPLTVRAVLADGSPGSRFNLNPTPATPRNAFVPLRLLQAQLWPDKRGATRPKEPRVNALLVQGGSPEQLQAELAPNLQMADWDLVLKQRDRQGYLSLESRNLLLEPAVVEAALAAAQETGMRAGPTSVYLANSIAGAGGAIPYSVVAALDPSLAAPLGPFLPPNEKPLSDDEILLIDWKQSPLKVKPGDPITLTYFLPDDRGGLREATTQLRLRALIPLEGVAADPNLTPDFPGITNKLTIGEWDPPFPFDNKRVQKRDEDYWKKHRATPKAYVTPATGKRLWSSRFGQLTSIRMAPAPGKDLKQSAENFAPRLLAQLRPEQGGLVFDAVRERSLRASVGGTDFSLLFLGFSCFLIAAALLLVGLLFRLNLDRRADEIGLLLATGYRRGTVRGLLLAEGSLLTAGGALVGLAGAVLYAWLLLEFLRTWRRGDMDPSFLRLHVTALSFGIGYLATLVVSMLTIAWAVRVLGQVSPRALLAGETTAAVETAGAGKWSRRSLWVAIGTGVGAVILLFAGTLVRDHEARAGTFFTSGFLLLTSALTGLRIWMLASGHGRPIERGPLPLARLGIRNAARHPSRSMLTAGLLAAAAFLVVAVESFRRSPDADFLKPNSGSGGFAMLAESDLPVYQNLDRSWQLAVQAVTPAQTPGTAKRPSQSDKGEEELADKFERQLQRIGLGAEKQSTSAPSKGESSSAWLEEVSFVPFRLRLGDDASCLNLYQPGRPRLLGVPKALIARGGFHFADVESSGHQDNPWLLLEEQRADGVIPVFGEKNTVTWMLKKKLGETLTVPNERGEPVTLRIVGLLQDSVFQGELLMSEANFLKLYPGQEGYNFFLIDVLPGQAAAMKTILDTALADRGLESMTAAAKLEAYLAVENTYLSTFQLLGGLGLVLGALGLAVVLLRSVWERRGELALLRALGFRHSALGRLVLAENAFLLATGLAAGTAAALLSVAPHVTGGESHLPWPRLLGLLALVLLVGLASGAAAVTATLRAPLVPALRRE